MLGVVAKSTSVDQNPVHPYLTEKGLSKFIRLFNERTEETRWMTNFKNEKAESNAADITSFCGLPVELSLLILSYLDNPGDLLRVAQLSTQFFRKVHTTPLKNKVVEALQAEKTNWLAAFGKNERLKEFFPETEKIPQIFLDENKGEPEEKDFDAYGVAILKWNAGTERTKNIGIHVQYTHYAVKGRGLIQFDLKRQRMTYSTLTYNVFSNEEPNKEWVNLIWALRQEDTVLPWLKKILNNEKAGLLAGDYSAGGVFIAYGFGSLTLWHPEKKI